MNFISDYSEDTLVEQPAIALFAELGWQTADCFSETFGTGGMLGRETAGEVVLTSRLRPALERLNRGLPAFAFDLAIEELTRDRSAMSLARANSEVYRLIKDGVKVRIPDLNGEGETVETVRVIDWNEPDNDDFFLASQFWVTGEMHKRRADLVGFVNGIPFLFIELKAPHKRLETAYTDNLTDYKDTIPHILWYNQLVIISNGSESKVGSATAAWEHFADWKKINDEGEEGIISLATMIRGTCEPERLLDLVENYMVFMEVPGGLVKLVAKNHQYFGVERTIAALRDIKSRNGKLGVFWHTPGSGKSVSMIFFSQKILRKISGNWTFVIVTDRKDLDTQIYKNFANTGVVTEEQAQATSSAHLRQLLGEDHRYVFTLIQKFRAGKGERHPVLSERSDIIVITDEAHRSQYDTLALNMRTALPNASFIAFTGTPLIIGEEKTRDIFGDYISIFGFKQSVEDCATVPLYYENRIPEIQLTNEDLNKDMERLLEDAELDDEQEKRLEREFARQYHLITREDRIETVAEDIVSHFMGRGFRGKAMVVSIDKATAIRMYDKVRKHWKQYLDRLRDELAATSYAFSAESAAIEAKIHYMEETDMAVVISQSQNEVEEMRKKGLDIIPHRRRIVNEDMDSKFKDPDNPFRIVFVCAMWMAGFDAPSCSTIYLDKPMRNHTLMQAIARANRVFRDKVNGLIVDYVGIFRDMQKALAIYGSGSRGDADNGDTPVNEKSVLVGRLRAAIEEAAAFCAERGIELNAIRMADGFEKTKLLGGAVDAILINDESKKRYLLLAGNVSKLYRAILPDPAANELAPRCVLFGVIAQRLQSLTPRADISEVMGDVESLLDKSVASVGYEIRYPTVSYGSDHLVDLSEIDFDALRAKFEQGHKRTEAEKLRGTINSKLTKMIRLNRTRMDYLERFKEMIEEYNTGSMNIDEFFRQLVDFAQSLNEEETRCIAEQLSEEELAIFDLLTRPEIELSEQEKQQVKKVDRELLETLKQEKFVLDWRKHQQSRAAVRVTIEKILDRLPQCYTRGLYQQKCDLVYQHIYDSYFGSDQNVYAPAALTS